MTKREEILERDEMERNKIVRRLIMFGLWLVFMFILSI